VDVSDRSGAPGSKPVISDPGLRSTSPVTTLVPVLVTVLPPSTAYDDAVPRSTGPLITVSAWAGTAEATARAALTPRTRPARAKMGEDVVRAMAAPD